MELKYNTIQEIDWKEVKKTWDNSFVFYQLIFIHEGHEIQFKSELDYKKKYRLMLYIDGWWKGEWANVDKNHEYLKFHNKKLLRPSKAQKELNLANKKMCKLLKRTYEEPKPYYYYSPIFDNIAQVKKMVENLTAK